MALNIISLEYKLLGMRVVVAKYLHEFASGCACRFGRYDAVGWVFSAADAGQAEYEQWGSPDNELLQRIRV